MKLRLGPRGCQDRYWEGPHQRPASGDHLQPDLLPPLWLDAQKLDMGSAAFEAQYQQQPLPAEGNMIKKEWFRYSDTPPRHSGRATLSLDTATKDDTENDHSACTVWLEADQKHHLIHVWRGRVNFPALRTKVLDMIDVFRPNAVLVEDAGSGSALFRTSGARSSGDRAQGERPKSRAPLSASAYLEAGLMWLPRDAAWLAEFEAELLGFPGARYDDQVTVCPSTSTGFVRGRKPYLNGSGCETPKRCPAATTGCPFGAPVKDVGLRQVGGL